MSHPNKQERDRKIVQLLREGKTGKEIATQLGVSPATVSRVRKVYGMGEALPDWDKLDPDLIRYRGEGMPMDEISKRLGVSHTGVLARVKKLGLPAYAPKKAPHGQPGKWQAGCRCEICLPAMRAYKKAEVERAKKAGPVSHGRGGYGRGCRCEICVTASHKHLHGRQRRTRETATNHGKTWQTIEDDLVMDTRRPIEEIADALGRTYAAVDNRRRYLEKCTSLWKKKYPLTQIET